MNLLPYYFLVKNHAAQVFFVSFYTRFSVLFRQKSKKIWLFFAIFSRCVSMIYEKVEKKVAQNS